MKKITALNVKSGRGKPVSVSLDGHPAFTVTTEVVVREGLAVGQELSQEQIKVLLSTDLRHRTLQTAMRYLSYRLQSESEIRQKLRRRGFYSDDIEAAICRLKELGLIDDVAFSRSWKENREQFSPRSRRLTMLELSRKGVAPETIDEALDGSDDNESAYRAASSKVSYLSLSDYREFYRRLGGYLQRRGFAYGVIKETVARLWQELGGDTPDMS
jgi:regulatory protein